MAAAVNRVAREALLRAKTAKIIQQAGFGSSKNMSGRGKKLVAAALGLLTAGGIGAAATAVNGAVNASTEMVLHAPHYEWPHEGWLTTFDKRSVKRGYEVYKQVCAACHSVKDIHFRDLVGVIYTEEEAKTEALEFMVEDGPDDTGNMFTRPGKLFDVLPKPYPNAEAAKAANNGVEPPDLSVIVKGRAGGANYIFALLTGYCDPPAGVSVTEGIHYNPYFAGGLISMAQALYNEIIEYEDGTPATQSQLAKDVVTFLCWTAEPEHDVRKKFLLKTMMIFATLLAASYYFKRHRWSTLKNKVIVRQR